MNRPSVSYRSIFEIEADIAFVQKIADPDPKLVDRMMTSFVQVQIQRGVWSEWLVGKTVRDTTSSGYNYFIDPKESDAEWRITVKVYCLPEPVAIETMVPGMPLENLAWRAALAALRAEKEAAKAAIARPAGSARWISECGSQNTTIDVTVIPPGLSISVYRTDERRPIPVFIVDTVDSLTTLIQLARKARRELFEMMAAHDAEQEGDDDDDD